MSVINQRVLWPRFSLSKPWIFVIAVALILAVGVFDYRTAEEIHASAFYLLPICWVSWKVGRRLGLALAVVSTVVWLVAEIAAGFPYARWEIPYWNALMLLSLYLLVVYLLSAFQAAHYRLEEIVQQRTAALLGEMAERKRLERAKLQAERLAVVGTMAAEVAHEVRNPLASITLNLDLVQKEIKKLTAGKNELAQEGFVLVGEMREEIRRIQRVIEDYLRFARLPKPQIRTVMLNELLEQKLNFLKAELDQKGVKLNARFDPGLKQINADAEQLWQAILNLVRNSLEAMPDGGELHIGTSCGTGEIRLYVTDTGKGMPAHQLEQVFTPFFTTKAQGTGLGLALVQQIVIEHGGHVECESRQGQGATFTIILPSKENE